MEITWQGESKVFEEPNVLIRVLLSYAQQDSIKYNPSMMSIVKKIRTEQKCSRVEFKRILFFGKPKIVILCDGMIKYYGKE